MVFGLIADDADATYLGAAPEERALWAFGHLHPLQVVELGHGSTRARGGHTVKKNGDARLAVGCAVVVGDAADDIAGIVGTLYLNLQTVHHHGHVVHLIEIQLAESLAGDGAHGRRHLYGALPFLLRGDYHFVEHLVVVDHHDTHRLVGLLVLLLVADIGEFQRLTGMSADGKPPVSVRRAVVAIVGIAHHHSDESLTLGAGDHASNHLIGLGHRILRTIHTNSCLHAEGKHQASHQQQGHCTILLIHWLGIKAGSKN